MNPRTLEPIDPAVVRPSSVEKKRHRKLKLEKLRQEKHATTIQSIWRGAKTRKELEKNTTAGSPCSGPTKCDNENVDGPASSQSDEENKEAISEDIVLPADAQKEISSDRKPEDEPQTYSWPETMHDTFEYCESDQWHNLETASHHDIMAWVLDNKKVLFRAVTWNMMAKKPPPAEDIQRKLLPLNRFHIIAFGTEECERSIAKSAVNPSKRIWEAYLLEVVGEKYVPLRSHTLQATHIMVFVHAAIMPMVSEVSSAAVACGVANKLGNKGGVAVSMKIADSRFVIVNAHLAAHQNDVDERNAQIAKIFAELPSLLVRRSAADKVIAVDPSVEVDADNKNNDAKVPENGSVEYDVSMETFADRLVFMGDLNYRINGNRSVVDKLLRMNMYEVLQSNDQLRLSKAANKIPTFLHEAPVHFFPTYKLDAGKDDYDTGPKQRIPSWTDRILYKQDGMEAIAYDSVRDVRTSDHRPVFASFIVNIDAMKDNYMESSHAFSSESQVCRIM
mmetsp:Transcript_24339/g.35686  ORF Transcript_24339/g.35686 Transcript_24339/m.35686 type:complete len:505 (+) Transcript_24339:266-1780(+)|eukprot:CAMPEP_0185037188 /NCGR_PEP_ID=MMETSP1103-20130426/31240_1 /TAXON_ID=36769 /ORGANISM="Paraphysomonas bandaiensis, Strain Caron Lab Isolate" /LENGTH=504 /DNA_ID=CAMNT_0027575053 /DNA_START=198 /DNA_END=1712 /DNA_ORIENTATION=-